MCPVCRMLVYLFPHIHNPINVVYGNNPRLLSESTCNVRANAENFEIHDAGK